MREDRITQAVERTKTANSAVSARSLPQALGVGEPYVGHGKQLSPEKKDALAGSTIGDLMKYFNSFALAALSLFVYVAPAEAESRSAVLAFPADGVQLHAVFNAAQDLLKRDSTITKSLVDQRLETSDTVYDTISAFSSGTAKSSWTWALAFHVEPDGRVAVTINHTAEGHRPPKSLVDFARNLVAALNGPTTGVTLEVNGVKKPLPDWKRP